MPHQVVVYSTSSGCETDPTIHTNINQHQPTSTNINHQAPINYPHIFHPFSSSILGIRYPSSSSSPFWESKPPNASPLQPGNAFLQLLSSPASSWISCFNALRSICLPRADGFNGYQNSAAQRYKQSVTAILVVYLYYTCTIPPRLEENKENVDESHLVISNAYLPTSCPPRLAPVSEIPFVHHLPEAQQRENSSYCPKTAMFFMLKIMLQY